MLISTFKHGLRNVIFQTVVIVQNMLEKSLDKLTLTKGVMGM